MEAIPPRGKPPLLQKKDENAAFTKKRGKTPQRKSPPTQAYQKPLGRFLSSVEQFLNEYLARWGAVNFFPDVWMVVNIELNTQI